MAGPASAVKSKKLTPEVWRGCVIMTKVMVRNYVVKCLGHGKELSGLVNFLNCSHSMRGPGQF